MLSMGLSVLSTFFFFFFFLFRFSGNIFFFGVLVMDKFSFLLVFLTIWVMLLLLVVALKYKGVYSSFLENKQSVICLSFLLFLAFCFHNILGFYVFFELSLVPLLFIMLGWGYQVERIQASFYLFVYTVLASLPFFMVLLYIHEELFFLLWALFCFVGFTYEDYYFFSLIIFISFFVKLPLYGVHLWLPKAHVEAPVGGSMVLAAVLLKLGGYGVYRFISLFLCYKIWALLLVSISLWGAVVCGFICSRQGDMKALIAYSSISHMGAMLAGYLVLNVFSIKAALIILLGHGFCSSALFFLVNFLYERNLTRQLLVIRGSMFFSYFMVVFWFLFLVINFGAPPFLSVYGELLILFGLVSVSSLFVLVFGVLSFLVAYYCIFFFSSVLHGHSFKYISFSHSVESTYLMSVFHFYPLIGFVLKMEIFIY